MKALIWIGCMLASSFIRVVVFRNYILGAIPTILIYVVFSGIAKVLCDAWDQKRGITPNEKVEKPVIESFSSPEEAAFVHNAISNGATFDEARNEWKRQHPVFVAPMVNAPSSYSSSGFYQGNASLAVSSQTAVPFNPSNQIVPPSVVRCCRCGAQMNAGQMFCTNCGEKAPVNTISTPQFCHECGAKLPARVSFCPQCGSKV